MRQEAWGVLRAGTLGAITDSSQVQEGQALPQPGAKQQVTSGGGGGGGKRRSAGRLADLVRPSRPPQEDGLLPVSDRTRPCAGVVAELGEVEWPLPQSQAGDRDSLAAHTAPTVSEEQG